MIEKGLEEENPQIEGHPKKNFKKSYVKEKKKKSGMEGECLSILREVKEVQIGRAHV